MQPLQHDRRPRSEFREHLRPSRPGRAISAPYPPLEVYRAEASTSPSFAILMNGVRSARSASNSSTASIENRSANASAPPALSSA